MKFKKITIVCVVFVIMVVFIYANSVKFINNTSINGEIQTYDEIEKQKEIEVLNQLQQTEKEEKIVDVPVVEETPQVEPVVEKNEEIKNEPIIEKKTGTIKDGMIQEDKSKNINNSIKKPIEEQEIITNKEEDSKQDITNEEEIKEVEVEKVDLEYENLLKKVEYSTYDECMNIGFEKALEDTVNILGFSCPYIAYKGKIIGYKLQLNYTNPMEN